MATTQIKRMSFPTLLLVLALLKFQLANAVPNLENLCRNTPDSALCLKSLKSHPHISKVRDIDDVLSVAIKQATLTAEAAYRHLKKVSLQPQYSGPNGKRRMEICKTNIGMALNGFDAAQELRFLRSFKDVSDFAVRANDAMHVCEHGWLKGGPMQKSPFTYFTTHIFTLSNLIVSLVKMLV